MILQMMVGWFAVLAGLVLMVHAAFVIRLILSGDSLAAGDYLLVGLRCLMIAAGGVLVYFGLSRLRRPRPRGCSRKPATGPDASGDRPDQPQ